ncbi:MAG: redoxin domain-containing protein, partial [Acidimicrobiales bacterium]|nr:redoxin domain-containing protein [Acidimicrobiales bacterium]
MEGGGFRDRAPEFEAANAVIVGASFDSVEDQKKFADEQSFPYALIS